MCMHAQWMAKHSSFLVDYPFFKSPSESGAKYSYIRDCDFCESLQLIDALKLVLISVYYDLQ